MKAPELPPGPYEVEQSSTCYRLRASGGELIGLFYRRDMAKAASALPQLLEALDKLAALLEDDVTDDYETMMIRLDKARAALLAAGYTEK